MKKGWFFESKRHEMARKGIKTGSFSEMGSPVKQGFFQNGNTPTFLAKVGDMVEVKDTGEVGHILYISGDTARILTKDKRQIDVPVENVEKMDREKKFMQLKEESDLTFHPAESNPHGFVEGEFRHPDFGAARIDEWVQLFPHKPLTFVTPLGTVKTRTGATFESTMRSKDFPEPTPQEAVARVRP
jgi:hypothetical protein